MTELAGRDKLISHLRSQLNHASSEEETLQLQADQLAQQAALAQREAEKEHGLAQHALMEEQAAEAVADARLSRVLELQRTRGIGVAGDVPELGPLDVALSQPTEQQEEEMLRLTATLGHLERLVSKSVDERAR